MKLGWKLGLGMGLGVLVAVVVGWRGLVGMAEIDKALNDMYGQRVVPLNSLKTVADMYAVNIVDTCHKVRAGSMTFEEGLKNIHEARSTIDSTWSTYSGGKLGAKEAELVSAAKPLMATANSTISKVEGIMERQDKQALADFCRQDLYPAIDPISNQISNLVAFQLAEAKNAHEDSLGIYETDRNWAFGIIAVGVVAIGIATVRINRGILGPVSDLSARFKSLTECCLTGVGNSIEAMCRGDLTLRTTPVTTPVEIRSNDEIGHLGRQFNTMLGMAQKVIEDLTNAQENLSELVRTVGKSANRVSEASGQLSLASSESAEVSSEMARTITHVSQAADQTATASQQIARASEQLAGNATEASAAMERLAEAIDTVLKGSQEQQEAARRATTVAEDGAEAVEHTITSMDRIQKQVTASAEAVRDLGEQQEKIGAIVQTIDEIAEQTNLLALNAAIEAARAGEQGRGFAVVADEVRKLAERSSEATKEIAGLIENVSTGVASAISAMEASAREVSEGTTHSDAASKALGAIEEAINAVRDLSERSEKAVEDMRRNSDTVTNAITSVASVSEETAAAAQQMSATTEEVSASAQQVTAAVEEQTASASEVANMSSSLARESENLSSLVAQFKTEAGAAPVLKIAA
ncbi:MAG: methyl-accepting chemotaxis protein [Fimbriimonadaceae bacterium]|nr:methyl-accepting chemotaxis protein [Fimbriimonadaceae bacterium]